jgi:exopolysaccharide biosynthesis polyprenyl glycosylphosphotransferase
VTSSTSAAVGGSTQATTAEIRSSRVSELPAAVGAPDSERRGYIVRRLTALADLVALVGVGALAALCLTILGRPIAGLDVTLFLLFVPVWLLIALPMRAYHPATVGRGLSITITDEFATIFRVATTWSWFLLIARSAASAGSIELVPSLLLWALSIPMVLLCRSGLRQFARQRGWYQQSVMVIGRRSDAAKVVSRIDRHPEWGLEVVEQIDVGDADSGELSVDGHPALQIETATAEQLLALNDEASVSRVIFATPPGQLDARTDLTRAFIETGIQVDFVPGEAEILRSGAVISNLEGLPLMSMPGARPPRSWGLLKRLMDLVVAVPTLIVAFPILLYAAVRIKLDSPGPVFYRQLRAGKDGKQFHFLKLRTMSEDADQRLAEVATLSLHDAGASDGIFKAVDDPRVTRFGRWLRRRSLDEVPQLWNVVKGNMSLVGPRPLPVHEDERVAGHYELRRHVKPGMTGPWQVSGRSDIPFHDMLRLDYSYVLNWSLSVDVKLLVQTIDAVARGRGAY